MHMQFLKLCSWVWPLTLSVWFATPEVSAAPTDSPTDLLATLQPDHPRLLAAAKDWDGLRARRLNDAVLARLLAKIESDGRQMLPLPTLAYKKEGKRLLAVSRAALNRITVWAFCHRLTADRVFAERAQRELLVLAGFSDWNPSHFLDTAEMTAALAIGYDWLHDQLSPSAQAIIRQAIVEKGLRQAVGPGARFTSWQQADMNWNQVCFGGLTLGALAIADEEPAVARQLLAAARKDIGHGLRPYAPAGVYPEGPNYWNYGTTYQVLMIAALESALGGSWQLDASPGFLASAAAQLQQAGPTRKAYNFADGGEQVRLKPALFWFAKRLQKPELVYSQRPSLDEILTQNKDDSDSGRFLPLIALWWSDRLQAIAAPRLPLAWFGDGPNPIGVFRSSWTDTNALYLAFKGGSAGLNHAHMDAGSFILEADGVRWACDLGAQDYFSIESKGWHLWDREQTSDRWRVYRLNNFSHNTLTLGGQLHRVTGDARIVAFNADAGRATLDLTKIFAGQATNVVRHFQLGKNREVDIRDELSGLKPGETVRWQLVTHAKVEIARDHAVLRQAGKTLQAQLITPVGANFEVIRADPPLDGVNEPNPDTWILLVNACAPANGQLLIKVSLRPDGGG
jgi:hypothetical protein